MIENFQSFLKLRPRSNWEACDSGILIWRNSIAYILLFMGIPFLCCVVFFVFLTPQIKIFGTIILWWLNPFFDRFILHVISVRFFKKDADCKTIAKGLIKSIFKGLIGDIVWRRFSIYRAARLPVRILEGNKGKMIKRRIKTLKNGGLDFCALLSGICIMLEIVLFGGFAIFLYGFFAEYSDFTFDLISNYSLQVSLVILFLASLIILIVEPLYMCMGFALYINSRSVVEGWDIELEFNAIIKSKQSESVDMKKTVFGKTIPLAVFILILSNVIQPLQAQEWHQNNLEKVPTEILDEILSSEDFGGSHTRKWIRFKELHTDESFSGFNFDEKNLREIAGIVLRALLTALIIIGLFFAAYRLYKSKKLFQNNFVPWRKKIVPGFVHKENPQTLINDAEKLFRDGQIRKAWSFCLSAVLGLYSEYGNIIFAVNDTESDCLVRINNSALWGKEDSARLILNWIKLAYADIEPSPEQFSSAVFFYGELKNKLSAAGDINE